jgi:filamentous hemagglutinin
MTIIVRGERVCSYCISADNILAAANRSGLNKLQIMDTEAGVSFVWRRGEKVWTRK